jgi:hypothetical protein
VSSFSTVSLARADGDRLSTNARNRSAVASLSPYVAPM